MHITNASTRFLTFGVVGLSLVLVFKAVKFSLVCIVINVLRRRYMKMEQMWLKKRKQDRVKSQMGY